MRDLRVKILFNLYGYYKGTMAGSVFDTNGLAPTISTMGGGNRQPMIFEIEDEEDTIL
jgi:hypothetical protein